MKTQAPAVAGFAGTWSGLARRCAASSAWVAVSGAIALACGGRPPRMVAPPVPARPAATASTREVEAPRTAQAESDLSPAVGEDESSPASVGGDARPQRGWLGVELAKRDATEPGVLVRDVLRGSPAERAGVLTGDVLLSIDGENVALPEEVSRAVAVHGAGERVRIGLLHERMTRLLAVELERFPDGDELLRRQYVGNTAPEFDALQTAQGSTEPRLGAWRGKVVVLEFWASWCGPCHLLSPVLQRWHERFTPQGVVVAGVSAEELSVVSRSANQLGIAYPVFADPSGATTKAYRALTLPTVFVLDKGLHVRDVMVGFSTPGLLRLESLVKRLIREPVSAG